MSLFWFLLGLGAGESSGREIGREEGLDEARRRLSGGDYVDGRPRISRASPPPPPPTVGQWVAAALIFTVGILAAYWISENLVGGNSFNGTSDEKKGIELPEVAMPFILALPLVTAVMGSVPLFGIVVQFLASREVQGVKGESFRFGRGEE